MKTLEEIKKEIQELQFAINPTETKGVLWKWTKHGLDILSLYVESTISQTKQELIGEIEKWRVEQIGWYKSGNDESFKDQAGERIIELMALGYQLKKLSNK